VGSEPKILETAIGLSSSSPFPGTNVALKPLILDDSAMADNLKFESLVERYYAPLYQFAFSLTTAEADACDLTQQTFTIWATKGHQLRDISKVKTWLFTTLHREFLGSRRRLTRFPHVELDAVDTELPVVSPATVCRLDTVQVLDALKHVDEVYQAAVALFYLQDCSYNEMAEILGVPLGTVKSRLARGISQLQQLMAHDIAAGQPPTNL
jgi:RNA polymerase sigma factor (sigma-70 family)